MAGYCGSEPVAAVGDPPRDKNNRDGRSQAPPNRKQEIRQQTKDGKDHPKDFSLHAIIVGQTCLIIRVTSVTRRGAARVDSVRLTSAVLGSGRKFTKSPYGLRPPRGTAPPRSGVAPQGHLTGAAPDSKTESVAGKTSSALPSPCLLR